LPPSAIRYASSATDSPPKSPMFSPDVASPLTCSVLDPDGLRLADGERGDSLLAGRKQVVHHLRAVVQWIPKGIACPPSALNKRFVKDLAYVRSYVLRDGNLYISLLADGGRGLAPSPCSCWDVNFQEEPCAKELSPPSACSP
jgi:hypothetical protein